MGLDIIILYFFVNLEILFLFWFLVDMDDFFVILEILLGIFILDLYLLYDVVGDVVGDVYKGWCWFIDGMLLNVMILYIDLVL